MALLTQRSPTTARHGKVSYPDSDGKPMAETDLHRNLMMSLIGALRWRYRDDPLVYVSGNLLLYYQEGDPRRSTAPDVFVVKGVPAHDRRTYLLWEEGVAPCVAIELTSRKTRREDVRGKPELYARLGIREYFMFDPMEEYLRPALQGNRLGVSGGYVAIKPEPGGALVSVELGLRLERAGRRLRLWDLGTGEELLDDQRRADAEHTRADAERTRAELERERAAEADRREADAHRRAVAEHQRAEAERARADTAEADLARLRAMIERRQGPGGGR